MDFKLYSPELSGVKSSDIVNFINAVKNSAENQDIHSFMLMRNGNILAEGYNVPYCRDTEHEIFSGSKAFAAMATGFAIDEGLLSFDDTVAEHFADFVPEDADGRIRKITVRNLLTMTVGQAGDPVHCAVQSDSDNWVYNFFRRECIIEPGTEFRYDNYATYMLSALINKVAGTDMMSYLKPRLFEPMGMEIPYHIMDKHGICVGYTGMRLTLSDFAKFGQLFLNKGKYNSKQILPLGWVDIATTKHIDTPNVTTGKDWNEGYCFQMWRGRHNTYRFCGAFGQMCVVVPDFNMIFAVQSGYDNNKIHTVLDKFYENIFFKVDKTFFAGGSYALQGVFEKLVVEDVEADKCFLHLQGRENLKLPCGIGRAILSEPVFTDLVAVNPQGGNVRFYSELNPVTDKDFTVKIKFVGAPSRININVAGGVADIEYIRCKV